MPYTFKGSEAMLARVRRGWTQRDVSRRCSELGREVSDSNLSKYERGEFCPSPPTLAVIAKALEIPVDDLITPRDQSAA
jgi:transcriptional regulator with XRE-family HTH domain